MLKVRENYHKRELRIFRGTKDDFGIVCSYKDTDHKVIVCYVKEGYHYYKVIPKTKNGLEILLKFHRLKFKEKDLSEYFVGEEYIPINPTLKNCIKFTKQDFELIEDDLKTSYYGYLSSCFMLWKFIVGRNIYFAQTQPPLMNCDWSIEWLESVLQTIAGMLKSVEHETNQKVIDNHQILILENVAERIRGMYFPHEVKSLKNLKPLEFYQTKKHSVIDLITVKTFLEYIENKEKEISEGKTLDSPKSTKTIQLKWNGQKNALTDIFKQLKNIQNKENEPLIGNSYEDIAYFLKVNFECFSDTKLSTIQTTLKTNSTPPKSTNRIIIEKEK